MLWRRFDASTLSCPLRRVEDCMISSYSDKDKIRALARGYGKAVHAKDRRKQRCRPGAGFGRRS